MMISCSISEVFPRLYYFWSEAFVRLKYHEFRVFLDKANGLALVQEEIVAYGAETELRL